MKNSFLCPLHSRPHIDECRPFYPPPPPFSRLLAHFFEDSLVPFDDPFSFHALYPSHADEPFSIALFGAPPPHDNLDDDDVPHRECLPATTVSLFDFPLLKHGCSPPVTRIGAFANGIPCHS